MESRKKAPTARKPIVKKTVKSRKGNIDAVIRELKKLENNPIHVTL